jgi:hypothetical protein
MRRTVWDFYPHTALTGATYDIDAGHQLVSS